MSKYWAAIFVNRLRVFALGSQENFDSAAAFAKEFVDRKNEEIRKEAVEKNIPDDERRSDYDFLCLLDENELRGLIGDVHRPLIIARPKREEVGVEAPVRRGGTRAQPIVNLPETIDDEAETTEI